MGKKFGLLCVMTSDKGMLDYRVTKDAILVTVSSCVVKHTVLTDLQQPSMYSPYPKLPFLPFFPPSPTPHPPRRASAMWHWPYCVSVGEKTFKGLLSLLNTYGNISGEPLTPFQSRE